MRSKFFIPARGESVFTGFAIFLMLALVGSLLPPYQAQAQTSAISKLSEVLQSEVGRTSESIWSDSATQRLRVLIQTRGAVTAALVNALSLVDGFIVRQFASIEGVLANVPQSSLLELAARPDVERITPDHLIQQTSSHLEAATLADGVRTYQPVQRRFNGLDGTGVSIAILDSGIMATHSHFYNFVNLPRVIASTDIVSSNARLRDFERTRGLAIPILDGNPDEYGHGSHVAGVAAGRSIGNATSRGFQGVAPNANLLDVRVLNGRGIGQVSDAIAGIDWVIANRVPYNIKVMNLSLGADSKESYETDPLCRAARRAVAEGITVVVAAGNFGLTTDGLERYGSITAPGNDPSVITVGSVNTQQSDSRTDEAINRFSSRGPTRSHIIEADNQRRYDHLLKPDLVAPGNRIISAESHDSWLRRQHPLHECGSGMSAFMQLSGTSISAPAVAGAAALLLQKNPGLTPPLIKAILQYTAQQLPNANLSQQGAGLLNIEGATRLAGVLRTDIALKAKLGLLDTGDSLLRSGASLPVPVSSVGGYSFSWGGYIFAGGSHLLAGGELFKKYQAIYDPALVWVRERVMVCEQVCGGRQLITAGVINADVLAATYGFFTSGLALSNGLAGGQGQAMAEGISYSNGLTLSEGLTLAEGLTLSEGLTLAEGLTLSEGLTLAEGLTLSEGLTLAESYNLGEP